MGAFVAAIIGILITIVCSLIPYVNTIAPLIGGFMGAYSQKLSVGKGILAGVYMGLIVG